MAATFAKLFAGSIGPLHMVVGTLTASGTTSNFYPGMQNVQAAWFSPGNSCTTDTIPQITVNKGDTGTAIAGSVNLRRTIDGSEYVVVCIGSC